jgi:hypothetical protein
LGKSVSKVVLLGKLLVYVNSEFRSVENELNFNMFARLVWITHHFNCWLQLAGALKAAVYCRGPLELPVFAGSAEMSKKNVEIALNGPPSCATEAIRQYEDKGAIAAFDRIPFSYASANFTFDTDTCVGDVHFGKCTGFIMYFTIAG